MIAVLSGELECYGTVKAATIVLGTKGLLGDVGVDVGRIVRRRGAVKAPHRMKVLEF